MEFVRAGYSVIGFDVSQPVVDLLNAGRSHIKDVPAAAVAAAVKSGKFVATTDLTRLREPDAISICVPTPLSKTKDPDVSYVLAATDAVKQALRRGQLLGLESTTYPATTRELMLRVPPGGGGPDRAGDREARAGVVDRVGGARQDSREHVPQREHRACQRDGDRVRQARGRRMGSH